jgi:hypothetical protein
LFVAHGDNGMWQLLDGEMPRTEEAVVVGLYSMTQKDASLLELADLPAGWVAWRESAEAPWQRELE